MTETKISTHARLDSHPDNIKEGVTQAGDKGRHVLLSLYTAEAKIGELADSVKDKAKLSRAVEAHSARVMKDVGKAINSIGAIADHYYKEMNEQLRPPVNPQLQAETRAYWDRQPDSKRFGGLRKAIDEGDRVTISCVLQAQHYLSGLSAKEHSTPRDMAAEKLTPELQKNYLGAVDALHKVSATAGGGIGGSMSAFGT